MLTYPLQCCNQNNQSPTILQVDCFNLHFQMPVIKIEFQGKIINLGSSISSFSHLKNEIIKRNPEYRSELLQFELAGKPIHDFSFLEGLKEARSVKIKVKLAQSSDPQSVSDQQTGLPSQLLFQKKENNLPHPPIKSKVYNFNMNDSDDSFSDEAATQRIIWTAKEKNIRSYISQKQQTYSCFNCQNTGFKLDELCQICQGKGYVEKGHPIFTFLNKIIEKRISAKIQAHQYSVHQKLSRRQSMEKKIKMEQQTEKKIEMEVKLCSVEKTPLASVFRTGKVSTQMEAGKPFTLRFKVQNSGTKAWPNNVYVREMKVGEIVAKLAPLKAGESTYFSIGPFLFQEESQFDLKYRFCMEDNESVFFGQTFGAKGSIVKPMLKKVLDNSFRERIEKMRVQLKIQRSVGYLVSRMQELGIYEDNAADLEDEAIMDLMNHFEN